MCIIVDANAAHQMHAKDDAGSAVLKWLLRGPGKLVISVDLLKELAKTRIMPVLTGLDRAGKLVRADDRKCNTIKIALENDPSVKSNDHHILALVILTACELVFTHDQPLHQDLKNRNLVRHSCNIYQTAQHRALLGACQC